MLDAEGSATAVEVKELENRSKAGTVDWGSSARLSEMVGVSLGVEAGSCDEFSLEFALKPKEIDGVAAPVSNTGMSEVGVASVVCRIWVPRPPSLSPTADDRTPVVAPTKDEGSPVATLAFLERPILALLAIDDRACMLPGKMRFFRCLSRSGSTECSMTRAADDEDILGGRLCRTDFDGFTRSGLLPH